MSTKYNECVECGFIFFYSSGCASKCRASRSNAVKHPRILQTYTSLQAVGEVVDWKRQLHGGFDVKQVENKTVQSIKSFEGHVVKFEYYFLSGIFFCE